MPKFPVGRDIFERVAFTFAEGAGGILFADQVGLLDLKGTELWSLAVASGAAAVLALAKSAFAAWRGKRKGQQGASLDPAVQLQPTQQVSSHL